MNDATWIVFGDDWGAHPSTTQYLVAELEGSVFWINSIGMRTPKLTRQDLFRAIRKVKARGGSGAQKELPVKASCFEVCAPKILPFHLQPRIRLINADWLSRAVNTFLKAHPPKGPVMVLSANPVANWYLNFNFDKLAYLRLDDYPELPGVDRKLAERAEAEMYTKADIIIAPAQKLISEGLKQKSFYLPQGVNTDNFITAPDDVPDAKNLGFFGLLAEWLDYDLVREVAEKLPEWTLEFIGPVRFFPDHLTDLPNVKLLPPVPYDQLSEAVGHWSAAWAPFKVNKLTEGVNPLKLREYLAAGLASFCTALPEAEVLKPDVEIIYNADDFCTQLKQTALEDTAEMRKQRKSNMRDHSWKKRAETLTKMLLGQAHVE